MRSSSSSSLHLLAGALLLVLLTMTVCSNISNGCAQAASPLKHALYAVDTPLLMNMSDTRDITVTLVFNKDLIPTKGADLLNISFRTETISPQFEILQLAKNSTYFVLSRADLESKQYIFKAKISLHASYMGHAIVRPSTLEFISKTTSNSTATTNSTTTTTTTVPLDNSADALPVVITKFDGIWGTIFIVSVSFFIILSYINLGAMLDTESMAKIVKKPKTLLLGFLLSALVMPLISWFVGQWLLGDQLLYRVGSFIFACGPAASASTLWTVMLDSDKELSVGLQVLSTVGALVTMPLLLYFMDSAIVAEGTKHGRVKWIKVPYARLMETLFVLLVALFIGWRFVGRDERAQKVARKIFRPLTFFVLLFIIVFSSIIYWYIYQMFDWNITLASLIITMLTYTISGILGHLINCNKDHAIAISISSAYKNSGIAFAVLLVAFDPPDTYIAYVPCLTQVVSTSVVLYLFYLMVRLVNVFRRRNQPDPIQAATADDEDVEQSPPTLEGTRGAPDDGSPSESPTASDKSAKSSAEDDEFIAMNVTDVPPGSPSSRKGSKATMANGDKDGSYPVSVLAN